MKIPLREPQCHDSAGRQCLLVYRQLIPDDVHALSQLVDGDFEDLIRKVKVLIKLFEDKSEKKSLGGQGPSQSLHLCR
jgi:hypothetical protein